MDEDNTKQYAPFGDAAWGFEALDSRDDNADTDAEMAIDNDSTAAEHDTDRDESWNDIDDSFQLGGGDNMDFEDDHAMYSGGRESEAFHVEDAAMMSDDVVDINLSDEPHSKMD